MKTYFLPPKLTVMKNVLSSIVILCLFSFCTGQTTITKLETGTQNIAGGSGFTSNSVKPLGNNQFIVIGEGLPNQNGSLVNCTAGNISVSKMFIGKYNATAGCWQWVMEAAAGSSLKDLVLDGSGNIFVAGAFDGTVIFPGNITKTSLGKSDIFLMKINASGVVQSVVTDGSAEIDWPRALTIDNSGNVYVSAIYKFDLAHAKPVNGSTVSSIYVAKYNNSLVQQWRNTYEGYASDNYHVETSGWDISVDNSGNIYQVGLHAGNVSFTKNIKISLTGSNNQAGFIVKYNNSGTPQWAKTIGKNSSASRVAVDGSGNVYMGGNFFNGTINFDNITLTQSGSWRAGFLAKFNSAGTAQWAKKMGGSITGVSGLIVGANNNLYALGSANSNPDTMVRVDGTAPFHISGSNNFVIASYTAAGNLTSVYMPTVTGSNSQNSNFKGTVFTSGMAPITGGYMLWGDVDGCETCTTTLTLDNSNIITANYSVVYFIASFVNNTPPISRRNDDVLELKNAEMKLYPNPANSQITLRNNENKILGNIMIYDASGKLVYQKVVGNPQTVIDIQRFVSGIYYVRSDQSNMAIKFVKQ
jgi:hypothetical protein